MAGGGGAGSLRLRPLCCAWTPSRRGGAGGGGGGGTGANRLQVGVQSALRCAGLCWLWWCRGGGVFSAVFDPRLCVSGVSTPPQAGPRGDSVLADPVGYGLWRY